MDSNEIKMVKQIPVENVEKLAAKVSDRPLNIDNSKQEKKGEKIAAETLIVIANIEAPSAAIKKPPAASSLKQANRNDKKIETNQPRTIQRLPNIKELEIIELDEEQF